MAVESKLKKDRLFLRFTWARLRNYLIRAKKSLYAAIILCGLIVGVDLYLGNVEFVSQSLQIAATLAAILFVFFFLITKDDNPVDIIISGAEGETTVLDELKRLDNSFVLFNRVILPDQKSTVGNRELDFIVISRKGIYIVEVKNNRGYIQVENMAERWQVSKTSQNNKVYAKTIKNPIRQTFAQKKVLQTYLYKQRIYIKGIPVVTVVIFANEDAQLSENFIADDANQAVLSLKNLLPFIKAKEEYLEKMPSRSRKKIIRKLEKK
ncbi:MULTISPECIES: nuclease-related domain-containing protein [unclassified Francisella]|uniref:nuclease-related domain-containing protein n=1 Tax=unclassified Francisella TaxID=2610885 RepID=UPI002E353A90|nr:MULTISPECIES: nuclease-related domain-containing protein [unclassified Francisella]MED7819859.1 nuclease-related domain-containing protein [Francisella sp. 19S2-4]MED7830677.1 nuclease-related domain-containing protein [Francisella sp. 19S2-10]